MGSQANHSTHRQARPKAAAALCLALITASACGARPRAGELPLRPIADVPLGETTRRFDYESLDPKTGLLFIADLAHSRVVVVDTRANTLRSTIPNVPQVHGVIAVPERERVFATATGADQMVMIDEKSLQVVARVAAGDYPDGLAFVPALDKAYVSDESGRTVTVIDTAHGKLLRSIPIGGEVGNTQFDAADGLIYSNDQSDNELVAIDPATDTVVGRWKWSGCEGSHGLQLDPAAHRAYAGCEGNDSLAVLSLDDHKPRKGLDVGGAPDVMAADFGLRRLYLASENGVVSVIDIGGPAPQLAAEGKLADNAHVVAVDQATHRVYFPLRNVEGKAVLRVMEAVR